jgi:hypothetical protein
MIESFVIWVALHLSAIVILLTAILLLLHGRKR